MPYIHSVFSAVQRHSVLVICLQAQTGTYTCQFTLSFMNLSAIQTFCLQRCTEAFCLGNMSSGTESNLHMPILPFPSRIFSGIETFCRQRCTETFCLGNMSSGTDSYLHMPIYPFLHEFSVAYRHSVVSAVRRHSVLVICLQAQKVTYTCLFTLSFTNFQWHTDILSSALYGDILSWQYVFRHRK